MIFSFVFSAPKICVLLLPFTIICPSRTLSLNLSSVHRPLLSLKILLFASYLNKDEPRPRLTYETSYRDDREKKQAWAILGHLFGGLLRTTLIGQIHS